MKSFLNSLRLKISNFNEHIKRTSSDLTTLELNTIVKTNMNCRQPSHNDRLALYQLASKYNSKLIELGTEYFKCIQSDEAIKILERDFNNEIKGREVSKNIRIQTHLFRRVPQYKQGGIVSFLELALVAKQAKGIILDNLEFIQRDQVLIDADISILTRIEVKSYEIVSILTDLFKKSHQNSHFDFWVLYDEEYKDRFQYLEKLHAMLNENIGMDESSRNKFVNAHHANNYKIELNLRDKIVVRKSLDLGTEHVLMQTRIGLDGDITTRISDRFANNPQQFVLDIHNDSIHTSIDYWTKIIDTLINYGQKLLKHLVE